VKEGVCLYVLSVDHILLCILKWDGADCADVILLSIELTHSES
jgi:hypothetical protein